MSLAKSSQFLSLLNDSTRTSVCEQSMIALYRSITDPAMNYLTKNISTSQYFNYWVPEIGSNNSKTGSRAIDTYRIVTIPSNGATSTSNKPITILVIEEWKTNCLAVDHIIATVHLKDYANCFINKGSKKTWSKLPFLNKYTKQLIKIEKTPKIDKVVYMFVSDRIAKEAMNYKNVYNNYNKQVIQYSTQKQIPVEIQLLTFKEAIDRVHNQYNIEWFAEKPLLSQLKQFSKTSSDYGYWDLNGHFIKLNSQELLPI